MRSVPTFSPQFLITVFLLLLFLTALGLPSCMQAFSTCSERASHCGAFSCCGMQALEPRLSGAWAWLSLVRGIRLDQGLNPGTLH